MPSDSEDLRRISDIHQSSIELGAHDVPTRSVFCRLLIWENSWSITVGPLASLWFPLVLLSVYFELVSSPIDGQRFKHIPPTLSPFTDLLFQHQIPFATKVSQDFHPEYQCLSTEYFAIAYRANMTHLLSSRSASKRRQRNIFLPSSFRKLLLRVTSLRHEGEQILRAMLTG